MQLRVLEALKDAEKQFKFNPIIFHRISIEAPFHKEPFLIGFRELQGKTYDFRDGPDNGLAEAEKAFESLRELLESYSDSIRVTLPLEEISPPRAVDTQDALTGYITKYLSIEANLLTPPSSSSSSNVLLSQYNLNFVAATSNYCIEAIGKPFRDSNGKLKHNTKIVEGPKREFKIPLITITLKRYSV